MIQTDILFLTVNEHETRQLIEAFKAVTSQSTVTFQKNGRNFIDLGVINGARCVCTVTEMGSMSLGASAQAVAASIASLRPKFVISIGIAFGIDSVKQKIGEVLVSQHLCSYEQQKVTKDGAVEFRSRNVDCSTTLLQFFRSNKQAHWDGVEVHFGGMVTGEKLIDNVEFRDNLKKFLGAGIVGGEMEGFGVYTACTEKKVDWIVVKAICDWADGNKGNNKESNQQLAAKNAASFVVACLQKSSIVESENALSDGFNISVSPEVQIQNNLVFSRSRSSESCFDPSLIEDGIVQSSNEGVEHGIVESARLLLRTGNPRAALSTLEKLESDLSRNATTDLRFRVSLYKACSFYQLEFWESAADHFERALSLRPENLKALVCAASFYANDEKEERAKELIDKAFVIAPSSLQVRAIRMLVYFYTGAEESIVSEFDSREMLDSVCGLEVLGQIAFCRGDYDESVKFFQAVLDREPENLQAMVMKAQSMLVPLENKLDHDFSRKTAHSQLDVEKVRNAEGQLTKAVEIQKTKEFTALSARTRLLRANARVYLERYVEAIEDCDSIPTSSDLFVAARLTKSSILVQTGHIDGGQRIYSELLGSSNPRIEVVGSLSELYLKRKDYPSVISLLTPFTEPDYDAEFRIMALERLILAYWNQGNTVQVATFIDKLKEIDMPEAKAILALHFARCGEYDEALNLLGECLHETDGDKTQERLKRKLLYVQAISGNFDSAIDTFRSLKIPSLAKVEIETLAIEMNGAGRFADALSVLVDFRNRVGATLGITDIEISFLVEAGRVEDARKLLIDLAELEPGSVNYQLRIAMLALRTNEYSSAKAIVDRLSFDPALIEADILAKGAYVYRCLGESLRALDLAFGARMKDSGNSQMHDLFIDCFMNCDFKFDCSVVDVNTTVVISDGTNSDKEYSIVGKRSSGASILEIEVDEELGRKLMGKCVGETVVLRDDRFGKQELRINEIRHKYVSAYQESLRVYKTRFPDSTSIRTFDDPNFVKLFSEVERFHKAGEDARASYGRKEITFEIAAAMAEMQPVRFWLGLTGFSTCGLQAFSGNKNQYETQKGSILSSAELVLDLTAILTIVKVGVQSEVVKLGKKLITPQFILDELNAAQFQLLNRPTSYIGKVGERFTLSKPEEGPSSLLGDLVRSARKFILESTEIVGFSYARLSLSPELKDALGHLGRSASAAITVASERGSCLLIDDDPMAQLLKGEDLKVGCVFSLLQVQAERKEMSEFRLSEIVCKLASINYRILNIRSQDLMFAFESSGGEVGEVVSNLLDSVLDPRIEPGSIAGVFAMFLRQFFFKYLDSNKRTWTLRYLLSKLTRRDDCDRILAQLKREISSEFYYMHTLKDQILHEIDCVTFGRRLY